MHNTLKTTKISKQKNGVSPKNVARSPLVVALHEGMANQSIRKSLELALDVAHQSFLDGDRFILFEVILYCATFQAVIPGWAVDALLDIGEGIDSGQIKDLNHAFGPARERVDSRRRKTRLKEAEGSVIAALLAVRGEGFSLAAAYAFDAATERLNSQGIEVNRRDVEDIYRLPRVRELIANWPQGKAWEGGVMSSGSPLRDWKQTSRPLWEVKNAG